MIRFLSRFVPRFGIASLIAAMLMCLSVAGWWRYEFEPDRQERLAIDALTGEGIGFRSIRRSQRHGGGAPVEKPGWLESSDPIVAMTIDDLPSDATRRRLLDLPRIDSVEIFGFDDFADGKTHPPAPEVEAMLGRGLPELSPASAIAEEAPPLPEGAPIAAGGDQDPAGSIVNAWSPQATLPRFLLHARTEDEEPTRTVCAVDVDFNGRWYMQRPDGPIAVSHAFVKGDRGGSNRFWNKGRWRLSSAERVAIGYPSPDYADRFAFPLDSLGRVQAGIVFLFAPRTAKVREARTLDEGGYLYRFEPKENPFDSWEFDGKLLDAAMVVGPAPRYVLKRLDLVLEDASQPFVTRRSDVVEYAEIEGHELPVRQFTWIRSTPQILGPFGETLPDNVIKRQTRFGWELDPELPADLFDPRRNGGEFFTSEPPPSFRWWYLTGGLAIAGLAILGGRGLLRRFRAKRAETVPARDGASGDG